MTAEVIWREMTWEKINSKVACRMIDTIERTEEKLTEIQPQYREGQVQASNKSPVSISDGW